VVVAGNGDPVTASRETEAQLEHQPHATATARFAADVVMD
jgi:hypothetical protein